MSCNFLPTDILLLRLQGELPSINALIEQVMHTPICKELQSAIVRQAWTQQTTAAYIYLSLPWRVALSRRSLDSLTELSGAGAQMTVARLALMQSLPGASGGERALFHYVVETTPETGWEVELQSWYATEHLPGLANVPGCVQAQRYWNHDAGPRSFACYDLTNTQALESPAWLAVRGTSWSGRVRARFTNTVRTMFTLQH